MGEDPSFRTRAIRVKNGICGYFPFLVIFKQAMSGSVSVFVQFQRTWHCVRSRKTLSEK